MSEVIFIMVIVVVMLMVLAECFSMYLNYRLKKLDLEKGGEVDSMNGVSECLRALGRILDGEDMEKVAGELREELRRVESLGFPVEVYEIFLKLRR